MGFNSGFKGLKEWIILMQNFKKSYILYLNNLLLCHMTLLVVDLWNWYVFQYLPHRYAPILNYIPFSVVTQNSANMGQWDVTLSVHVVCLISCPGGILVSLDALHTHICVVHNSSSKWSNSDEVELTGKFLILYVSFTTLKVFIGCCRFILNLGCLLPFATDDLLVTVWIKLLMVHTKQRKNPHRFSADLLTP